MKGATQRKGLWLFQVIVSIHAPVKGATREVIGAQEDKEVSIHAPVKGATQPRVDCGLGDRCFNPRPREGGDRSHDSERLPKRVSIHAPVKGATSNSHKKTRKYVFQSTPP